MDIYSMGYNPLLLLFNFVIQIVPDLATESSFSLTPVI